MEWTFLNLRGAGQRFRRVAPSRVRALDIKMDLLGKVVTPMVRSVSTSTVSIRQVKESSVWWWLNLCVGASFEKDMNIQCSAWPWLSRCRWLRFSGDDERPLWSFEPEFFLFRCLFHLLSHVLSDKPNLFSTFTVSSSTKRRSCSDTPSGISFIINIYKKKIGVTSGASRKRCRLVVLT